VYIYICVHMAIWLWRPEYLHMTHMADRISLYVTHGIFVCYTWCLCIIRTASWLWRICASGEYVQVIHFQKSVAQFVDTANWAESWPWRISCSIWFNFRTYSAINFQNLALQSFYASNWVATWLLRIFAAFDSIIMPIARAFNPQVFLYIYICIYIHMYNCMNVCICV